MFIRIHALGKNGTQGQSKPENTSYQNHCVRFHPNYLYWVLTNSSKFGRFGWLDLYIYYTHTSWVSKAVASIILLYAGQYNYTAQKNNTTHSTNRYLQNPAYVSPKENRSDHKAQVMNLKSSIKFLTQILFLFCKNVYTVLSRKAFL